MQAVFRVFPFASVIFAVFAGGLVAQDMDESLRPQGRPPPVVLPLDAVRPPTRPVPIGRALAEMRAGNWNDAAQTAARMGPVAADIIEWHRLRAGRGDYAAARAFLDRRPDWPGLEFLRKQSEGAVLNEGQDTVLAFFQQAPAQTVKGVLAHAKALSQTGREDEAQTLIVTTWRNQDLSDTEQALFLAEHAALLKDHHVVRLIEMLWQGAHNNARRMFSLVDTDHRALADARIALRNRANNAETLAKKVPEALRDHPLLTQARFEATARAGTWDRAKAMLLKASARKDTLGQPQAWANRRRVLARDELRDGDADMAYDLAAQHHLEGGSSYADLEWLAGYIALTKRDDPKQALVHFENHDRVVMSPISQGRAGYWKGRAHAAMGNAALADMEYAKGAEFQTSFYGLLAAEAAGLPFDVGISDTPADDWRDSPLAQDSLFLAGQMLAKAGERSIAERFWTHLAEQLGEDDAALLGQAAIDLNAPHLAVMIGKTVARRGVTIANPYYSLHPLADQTLPIATEMALAIARRESEFDPVVKSGAGALGLMQLMPATAREVAGKLGLRAQHSTGRLTRDPVYNARLGTQYLAELAERFGGNVVMVSAGYNAGPSRPERWMRAYGDPRDGSIEGMIDWIEGIPFRETRNYVMRVSESLPVYRARLGREALPIPFSQELRGSTLRALR